MYESARVPFWSARVPFAGTGHSRRDQHLGRRRGPLDLQADEEHHRRGRDAGACYQEGQAGVSDSSEGQPLTGGKGPTADPRCGCPASCRRTSSGPTTSEVSRAKGGAATPREEASRRPGEGPTPGECLEAGPEAAAQAAGAGGRAKRERVFVPLLFFNMINGNCDTGSILEKPTESEAN
jgi:hypothetical protein